MVATGGPNVSFPNGMTNNGLYLSDLQKAMLDATPDCIKVVSIDGNLMAMNKAGCVALAVPEDSEFGMPWLLLLPDDVRSLGNEALQQAVKGHTVRFPGKSISPNGVTYWDNLLTPQIDNDGRVLSILCVSRDITKKSLLERQLEEAANRERLLAHEMQHRIKNLIAVISGLTVMAEKEAMASDAPSPAMKIFRDKLQTLARASDAIFASGEAEGYGPAVAPFELSAVVHAILSPYGHRCSISGNPMEIQRDAMTTFALLLHELATNSIKYGALATEHGLVTVHWQSHDDGVDFSWIETGCLKIAVPSTPPGFGTAMIDRIIQVAGGIIHKAWQETGLTVNVRLPKQWYLTN